MLSTLVPRTARPAKFGSMRGIARSMFGTREEILRLGERMMLCAKAGELSNPIGRSNAASRKPLADRSFSRQIGLILITGFSALKQRASAHGVATARLTIFSFSNLLRRAGNSSFDIAVLENCR